VRRWAISWAPRSTRTTERGGGTWRRSQATVIRKGPADRAGPFFSAARPVRKPVDISGKCRRVQHQRYTPDRGCAHDAIRPCPHIWPLAPDACPAPNRSRQVSDRRDRPSPGLSRCTKTVAGCRRLRRTMARSDRPQVPARATVPGGPARIAVQGLFRFAAKRKRGGLTAPPSGMHRWGSDQRADLQVHLDILSDQRMARFWMVRTFRWAHGPMTCWPICTTMPTGW
jgi:hypothetical protein